jgi:Tfp pilus assembly protein PilZ
LRTSGVAHAKGGAVSSENYQDRRRHRRVEASMPVRLSTIEPERDPWTGRPFFRASLETCGNVSRGGAYVQTVEPLAPGRRILLELTLPDGQAVEAIGRIAWSKRVLTPRERDVQAGIGVEFLGGAADQFAALENYIEKLIETDGGEAADTSSA